MQVKVKWQPRFSSAKGHGTYRRSGACCMAFLVHHIIQSLSDPPEAPVLAIRCYLPEDLDIVIEKEEFTDHRFTNVIYKNKQKIISFIIL